MPRTFPTKIDIHEDKRSQLIDLLNVSLAEGIDLYSQVKQAHWNVKGTDFIQLHEMFDDFAEVLEGHIDEIAERATALGGTALGTVRMAAAASSLPEYPDDVADGSKHVGLLIDRYAAFASRVRDAIDSADSLGDADTADLFTGVSRDIDKHLWFLEAHLQA
jgi:starvation-inducible DNA-binding protein